jgi:hypothetical protein
MLDIKSDNIENKIFSEKNGNFQTMNMIHKIKKIKKKRQQPENIKKMPFPEVLKNINDIEPEKVSNTPIIEGFDRFNFAHDDWDGYDNVKDDTGDIHGKDPRQIIIDFINYVYNSTIAGNRMLAHYLTDKISNNKAVQEVNKNIKKDVSDIKATVGLNSEQEAESKGNLSTDEVAMYKYICIFEALTFSCFVVNNWYFLMFYNNFDADDNYERKIPLTDFSVEMFKSLPDNVLTNRIIKNGFLYFFEYALVFPVAMQWFLLQIVPKTTIKWFNHMLLYIILFLLIFSCSYYLASSFKDFLIDCINGNMKNLLVSAMVLTVLVLFLVPDSDSEDSIFNHDYDARRVERQKARDEETLRRKMNNNTEVNTNNGIINNELDESNLTKQMGGIDGGALSMQSAASQGAQTIKQAAPKSKADAGASVLKIIWNCVRFLIIITISVPFGALFCVGYFIFYSLYAMIYYYDRDFTKIAAAFSDMLKFIDNKKETDIPRPSDSLFQLFVKKFYEYLEYISDNLFIIVYLITFIVFLTDSQKTITNSTMRNALYVIDL